MVTQYLKKTKNNLVFQGFQGRKPTWGNKAKLYYNERELHKDIRRLFCIHIANVEIITFSD